VRAILHPAVSHLPGNRRVADPDVTLPISVEADHAVREIVLR